MKRQISVFRWVWIFLMFPWQEVIHTRSIIHLEDSKRPCWGNMIHDPVLIHSVRKVRSFRNEFQTWDPVPDLTQSFCVWNSLGTPLPPTVFLQASEAALSGRPSEGCGTWCWPEGLLSTLIDSTHLRKLMHLSDAQANCQLLLPPVNTGFWFGCHGYRKL